MRATLAAIKVIVDRTNCIYGVRDAMAREDYEAAAGFVGTFMEIEEGGVAGAAPDGAQAAEQAQVIPAATPSCVGTGMLLVGTDSRDR